MLVPFPGDKCRWLCRGLSGQQKSEEPAPGLAPQCPRVALEGYSPALGGGGAQPACAAGGLPGGTRPHLVISLQNHRCSITPSLMAKLGLAAAGRCGHCPSHPCPAPRLFWWVGLSSSAPHLPPMGLALRASLCEVLSCQAPACLVASFPPLCSSHLLTTAPLPSPSMSGSPGLNPQHSATCPHFALGVTATPTPQLAGPASAFRPAVLLLSRVCRATSHSVGQDTRYLVMWLYLLSSALPTPPTLPADAPQVVFLEPRDHGSRPGPCSLSFPASKGAALDCTAHGGSCGDLGGAVRCGPELWQGGRCEQGGVCWGARGSPPSGAG